MNTSKLNENANMQTQEQFVQMSPTDLLDVLGLTIKQDDMNKLVTFLCQLSAYTDGAQFNISFNAPSSSGKSYIPTEIAKLFPKEDVIEVGYCSPTAFYHDKGIPNPEKKGDIIIDFSRKILIFLDQPHNRLLENMRPVLSHDKSEIQIKIADKSQKQGLNTKNIIIRGFPAVIFCTAGLNIDEQEATRFLLLSPEMTQAKFQQGIVTAIVRGSNREKFSEWLESNPARIKLKERISAIKTEDISDVTIANPDTIKEQFLKNKKLLKPRHQRDIGRLLSLIKVNALLNCWWRKRDGTTIEANDDDIQNAFWIWELISESQEVNLPPYIHNLYKEVILSLWEERRSESKILGFSHEEPKGLNRKEICKKHYQVYGRMLDSNQFRMNILPMLETAGLIAQEKDENDSRQVLVVPMAGISTLTALGNSEQDSRVEKTDAEIMQELGL